MHRIILILALHMMILFTVQMAQAQTCSNNGNARHCMICNCFFEARGEIYEGKVAVAQTVLTRVQSSLYPNNECAVIYQRSQFSWTPGTNVMNEPAKVAECGRAVDEAYRRGANGFISFHSTGVSPGWRLARCTAIGQHIFYARSRGECPSAATQRSRTPAPGSTDRRGSDR